MKNIRVQRKILAYGLILAPVAACNTPQQSSSTIQMVASSHDDEGPADRYSVPYDPITYGQTIKAPLPGLAYDYKLIDWDRDGLVDILASVRRGGGIVFYKNVGSREEPLFLSLQENERIMQPGDFGLGRYFNVLDVDQDGKNELIGYGREEDRAAQVLTVYFDEGKEHSPRWKPVVVTTSQGDAIKAPEDVNSAPRLSVGDWNHDGKPDLVVAFEHQDKTVPADLPTTGNSRMAGFRDPNVYDPYTGEVWLLLNSTPAKGKPQFEPPVRMTSDGEPIVTYINPYPTTFNINQDSLPDLLVGSHNATIRVFINQGTRADPNLVEDSLLSDPTGSPLRTFLTIRVDAADMNGDGTEELISASYYGNQNRYLVYSRRGLGWQHTDDLRIQADQDTPVYGMGNSTVDPVDWDGDGDIDLLLGAEGSFPTVVINIGTEQNRVFDPARRLQYTDGSLLETFSIEQGDGSYWGPREWYSDRIAPRAADWDGDGVLDILTGSMGRRLYFFKGEKVNGELRFHKPANFRYGGDELVLPDRLFPAVLDWTGDGQPDVMVSDDPGHVLVYEGDGSLGLENPDTLMLSTGQPIVLQDYWERKKGNRSGFAVADWDGDGKRDLIIYMFHRGVFLVRNTGNDTFEEAQPLVPLYSHLAGPSVMDWNKDGVLDLIIGGDERRMIEPDKPAHLAVFYGEHTLSPPKNIKQVTEQ